MSMHGFKSGDYARNVEDGWIGRIEGFEAGGMARMVSVTNLAQLIDGTAPFAMLAGDDVRWYSVDDLQFLTGLNGRLGRRSAFICRWEAGRAAGESIQWHATPTSAIESFQAMLRAEHPDRIVTLFQVRPLTEAETSLLHSGTNPRY